MTQGLDNPAQLPLVYACPRHINSINTSTDLPKKKSVIVTAHSPPRARCTGSGDTRPEYA